MNNLCADIGYKSVNHYGEQLCGDHVDIVEQNDSSVIVVLADGLGSGVKASILSTLTSTIISTMMRRGFRWRTASAPSPPRCPCAPCAAWRIPRSPSFISSPTSARRSFSMTIRT